MARKRRSEASKRGKSHFAHAFLRLKKLSKGRQVQAIKMANDKFIRSLCVHVKKLKHVKLPAKTAASFRRQRKRLRSLTNSHVSIKKKRQILTQRGGFVATLLASLASTVLSEILDTVTKE